LLVISDLLMCGFIEGWQATKMFLKS
jgi:hypothetical protein